MNYLPQSEQVDRPRLQSYHQYQPTQQRLFPPPPRRLAAVLQPFKGQILLFCQLCD